MVLTALRGAVGFLTRVPIGQDAASWDAFRTTPVAFVLAGFLVGVALALPFFLPVAAPVTALVFLGWLYAVTGIPHADAIADLGDAAAVHGTPADRRGVMQDTTVGVGGVLALGFVLIGYWSAAVELAAFPLRAVPLVVTAEVGAKLAMATITCLGTPTHSGLGAAVAGGLTPRSLGLPVVVALPAAGFTWPNPAAAVAVVAAFAAGLMVLGWATRRLGGVSGDVIGGANELARLAALLAGVVTWTHF